MILLDTHIWIWWVDDPSRLSSDYVSVIEANEDEGLLVSRISVWEVAKLAEKNRIKFSVPVAEWIDKATQYPGVRSVSLGNDIIIESTHLPGEFHKDPADQLIVATARVKGISLLTADNKILDYPHANTLD